MEISSVIQSNVLVESSTDVTLSCPAGWFSTGGGWDFRLGQNLNFQVLENEPSGTGGWHFRFTNAGYPSFDIRVDVYVRCVRLVM